MTPGFTLLVILPKETNCLLLRFKQEKKRSLHSQAKTQPEVRTVFLTEGRYTTKYLSLEGNFHGTGILILRSRFGHNIVATNLLHILYSHHGAGNIGIASGRNDGNVGATF